MRKMLIVGLAAAVSAWAYPQEEGGSGGGSGGGGDVVIAVRVAAAVAAVHIASGAAVQTRDWDWKGRVDRGDVIEIRGVNGSVRAERTSGGEVEVVARIRSRKSDPESVRMEVVEHAGGVTVCAVYPSKDRDRPNECGGRRGQNVRDNDVVVDFTVRVPSGVRFDGRTVNGDVDVGRLDADVEARTVNGSVDISSSGLAEASTVNGSITASMGRADWEGKLSFTTVNGSVTLEFPADLSCEVDVSTVNGSVSSDFPITVTGRFSPRELRGTIGNGGRELKIQTVNGSVFIRRI